MGAMLVACGAHFVLYCRLALHIYDLRAYAAAPCRFGLSNFNSDSPGWSLCANKVKLPHKPADGVRLKSSFCQSCVVPACKGGILHAPRVVDELDPRFGLSLFLMHMDAGTQSSLLGSRLIIRVSGFTSNNGLPSPLHVQESLPFTI